MIPGKIRSVSGVATPLPFGSGLHPDGAGFKVEPVATSASGDYPGRWQEIHAGSFAIIDGRAPFDDLTSFTLQAMIWPTSPI